MGLEDDISFGTTSASSIEGERHIGRHSFYEDGIRQLLAKFDGDTMIVTASIDGGRPMCRHCFWRSWKMTYLSALLLLYKEDEKLVVTAYIKVRIRLLLVKFDGDTVIVTVSIDERRHICRHSFYRGLRTTYLEWSWTVGMTTYLSLLLLAALEDDTLVVTVLRTTFLSTWLTLLLLK